MTAKLYFVAFKGISMVSRLIRWWTRGPYSHIAIKLTGPDQYGLIEPWPYPFRWRYSSFKAHKPGTPYEIWALPVSMECKAYCSEFYIRLAEEGARYDWKGILGFINRAKNYEDPKGFFCSEGAIYPLVEWHGWTAIRPWRCSPTRFVELIEAAGAYKIAVGRVSHEDEVD